MNILKSSFRYLDTCFHPFDSEATFRFFVSVRISMPKVGVLK